MRHRSILAFALSTLCTGLFFQASTATNPLAISPVYAATTASDASSSACQFPMQAASSPEQTAWQIFTAATCPVNKAQYPYVVWETWNEQHQVYPASGGTAKALTAATATNRQFFKSALAQIIEARKHGGKVNALMAPTQGCTVSTTTKRTICEEVRINPIMVNWLQAGNLTTRKGQTIAAQQYADIEMPPPSVEIKADWIQLPSCTNPPQGVHIEQVGSTCYELAGMHLISKLLNQWIWATFEAQNLTSNPMRCRVLGCNDSWGSLPATSKGGPGGITQLTGALQALMQQANLAPEWQNYRLDGAQINFLDGTGNITLLGNSIIEAENAGVPLNQASCISCHAVSSVKSNGTDGITLLTSNPVGVPVALPDDTWIRRDFLWSASLACPGSPFQTCAPASPTPKPKTVHVQPAKHQP